MRPDFVQHRFLLGKRLAEQLQHRIRYGPFEGTLLIQDSRWSGADKASMLLGMYELEVLSALVGAAERRKVFIDVGAADGYYAVGATASNLFQHAICFEIDPEGRDVISRQASANGVLERVSVLGMAGIDFLDQAQATHAFSMNDVVILIDIEGTEFELLSESIIERLKNAVLIVEIHDFLVAQKVDVQELVTRLSHHFVVEIISQGPRDPNLFPELAFWNDDDRWIICSESRSQIMCWAVCKPK